MVLKFTLKGTDMRLNRLLQFVAAIVAAILLWWLAIRTIIVMADGSRDDSLVLSAIAIGALCFIFVQLVKAIDRWDG